MDWSGTVRVTSGSGRPSRRTTSTAGPAAAVQPEVDAPARASCDGAELNTLVAVVVEETCVLCVECAELGLSPAIVVDETWEGREAGGTAGLMAGAVGDARLGGRWPSDERRESVEGNSWRDHSPNDDNMCAEGASGSNRAPGCSDASHKLPSGRLYWCGVADGAATWSRDSCEGAGGRAGSPIPVRHRSHLPHGRPGEPSR